MITLYLHQCPELALPLTHTMKNDGWYLLAQLLVSNNLLFQSKQDIVSIILILHDQTSETLNPSSLLLCYDSHGHSGHK